MAVRWKLCLKFEMRLSTGDSQADERLVQQPRQKLLSGRINENVANDRHTVAIQIQKFQIWPNNGHSLLNLEFELDAPIGFQS